MENNSIYKFVFIPILIILLSSCNRSEKLKYELISNNPKNLSPSKGQPKVKMYLEASISMKGYVVSNEKGDFKLKDVVPFLLTDLDKKISKTELYTITDEPKKFERSRDEFYKCLRDGSILNGSSSRLHNIFRNVIELVENNSVSIIISDCILDLGDNTNMTQRSILTNQIYNDLCEKDLSAAVFQFMSDYNGDYYFDRNNTGNKNTLERPYHGKIMKNRPFYIWLIGDDTAICQILDKHIIKEYLNSFTYNLSFNSISPLILQSPKTGKVIISEDNRSFSLLDQPVSITLGVNLKTLPEYMQDISFLNQNLKIKQSQIHVKFDIYNKETIKKNKNYKQIEREIEKNQLSHFFTINFDNLKYEDDTLTIILNNSAPIWISESTIDDDLNIKIDSLQGKTFSFNYLHNAFQKRFEGNNIFTINFKLKKR